MIRFRLFLPVHLLNLFTVLVSITLQMLTFILVLDDYIPTLVWVLRIIILLVPPFVVIEHLPSEMKYSTLKCKILRQEIINGKHRNIVLIKGRKLCVDNKRLYNEHNTNDIVTLYKIRNRKRIHYFG